MMPIMTTADMRRDQPLTVGAIRRLLAEHHDSDLVAFSVDNRLYHPKVTTTTTAIGHTVVIERGDEVVW